MTYLCSISRHDVRDLDINLKKLKCTKLSSLSYVCEECSKKKGR